MSKIEELSIDQLCDKIESHGDAQYSARNEIKIRFADLELKLIDETALRMSHEGHIEKLEKQLAEGKSAFQGERGSKLATDRNKRLSAEGKHNFQQTGWVSVIDINGAGHKITTEKYWSQTGSKETWEFVQNSSSEAKRRKGTLK